MEGYVLEALFAMGFAEEALDRMKERYAAMAASADSTLWEDFGVFGTRNHAWSGGLLTLLYRYVAGIGPETPGYARYRVFPNPGPLSRIRARVPSVRGVIAVAIESVGGCLP
jgi:hypothetical protein